ncbi:MAG: RNA 2',3'-cyclic phosphodiesterase [Mycobacterium leprae]
MRTFVAVEVTAPALRRSLESAQIGLRRSAGTSDPVKWVPVYQQHITLKFLGEIPEEAGQKAAEGLQQAVRGFKRFTVQVAGLGAFPSVEQPSVLWAGLGSGKAELVALAAAVETELAQCGFPRERRPFQPHLTLGRVREGARINPELPKALAQSATREFGSWPVERIVLMKSELTPRGPIYTHLAEVNLGDEKPSPGEENQPE